MLYWVCVNDTPVALPTRDLEAAKQIALDHITAETAAHVEIDIYPGNSTPMTKLLYDSASREWFSTDALAP